MSLMNSIVRIMSFAMAVLTVLPVSSCKKDESGDGTRMWEVKVRIEQPVCDASSGAESISLTWKDGASVSLFQKTHIARPGYVGHVAKELKYTLKSGAGTDVGIFESPKATISDPITCYYPREMLLSAEEDRIFIPDQNSIPGVMDERSYPMCAFSRNIEDGIVLKPMMAIVQISLTGNCELLEINVKKPEGSMGGEATVDPETASLVFKGMRYEYNGIGFDTPVILSSKPTVFNFVVPPGEDEDIFINVISTKHGVLSKTFHHQTFKAGVIRRLADWDFGTGINNYEGLGSGVKVAGITWAPANCGQDDDNPEGLLYQWGRKYGQSYEAGSLEPVKMVEEYGADSFFRNYFGKAYPDNRNWFSWVDSSLWTEYRGVNDPCPEGWRVPRSEELEKLETESSRWEERVSVSGRRFYGRVFGTGESTVFFPASGKRSMDGSVTGFNESAGYWSCQLNRALSVEENGAELVERPLAEGHHVRCVSNRYD